MRALTRLGGFTASKDLVHIQSQHPVRRELKWKENREKSPDAHPLYPLAVEIQLRGNPNNPPCDSYVRSAGPFANGCVSFGREDAVDNNGRIPFAAYVLIVSGAVKALVVLFVWVVVSLPDRTLFPVRS
jgi:hypothetical protein